jgi:hypothetical protein
MSFPGNPFSTLVATLDSTVLNTFSEYNVQINYQNSQPNTPPVSVQCVTKNPAMEEDFVPGSPSSQGTTVLLLFIQFSAILVLPQKGDVAVVTGIPYDIWEVAVDREGGATLKCRRRGQPFNA